MKRSASPPTFRILMSSLLIPVVLLPVSCSKSKGSDDSFASVYTEVTREADPVAELTAKAAVAMLSMQASSDEAIKAELQTKSAPNMQQFKESLCMTLKGPAKKASDDATDNLRATANQAVRDSFILKLIQSAVATPPERQAELVQVLDIKSKSADGSALTGSAGLKDASLSSSQGTIQIPPIDTAEYAKYTDWLMQNSALLGFIEGMTRDYQKTIQDCAPG